MPPQNYINIQHVLRHRNYDIYLVNCNYIICYGRLSRQNKGRVFPDTYTTLQAAKDAIGAVINIKKEAYEYIYDNELNV